MSNSCSNYSNLRLLTGCFLFWCYFFGIVTVAIEATNRWTAAILIAVPIITFLIIKRLSISPPNNNLANEVLGRWVEEEEDDDEPTATNQPPPVNVWAHRFAGLDAPENTLVALETCIENGAKAVEFDLTLTADWVPVIFHDNRLDRITNCEADIRKTMWADLKKLDVSANHPFRWKYPNARIPLLADVVKICLENKIRMVIDVKDDRPEVVTAIVDTYAANPEMYGLALVSSFNPYIIWSIRRANPQIVAGLTWRPCYYSYSHYSPIDSQCVLHPYSAPMHYAMRFLDISHQFFFNYVFQSLIGFSIVLLEKDIVSRSVIEGWKKQNVRVMAWTVNIPTEKLMFVKHYRIPIITDSMLGSTEPTHGTTDQLK